MPHLKCLAFWCCIRTEQDFDESAGLMTKDQTDLFHPQTLARSTSTRDGEPLKSCVSRCQSTEVRLACLFFFLAILYDDEVAGEVTQDDVWPGQTKK